MYQKATSRTSILIASDSTVDAALVRSLLEDEFDHISLSVNPNAALEDFRQQRPEVLLLVFKELEKAEAHYLGLFRLGRGDPLPHHRAVILCSRETVQQAYSLCRRGLFDDYVLFWPSTHDAPRLLMSVRSALKDLRAVPDTANLAATCAIAAERLRELDAQLSKQQTHGQQLLATTDAAIAASEGDIGRILGAIMVDESTAATILASLRNIGASLHPLREWAENVQATTASCQQSLSALSSATKGDNPAILVVEDDAFQRRLVANIMATEPYELQFANSGPEALRLLCRTRPDLILTDYLMPEMNGIEFVGRLKAEPKLASIPVIMLTGSSHREVVVGSLEVGAIDFIVKPVERKCLLSKVARALHGSPGSVALAGSV